MSKDAESWHFQCYGRRSHFPWHRRPARVFVPIRSIGTKSTETTESTKKYQFDSVVIAVSVPCVISVGRFGCAERPLCRTPRACSAQKKHAPRRPSSQEAKEFEVKPHFQFLGLLAAWRSWRFVFLRVCLRAFAPSRLSASRRFAGDPQSGLIPLKTRRSDDQSNQLLRRLRSLWLSFRRFGQGLLLFVRWRVAGEMLEEFHLR
jgi:hypothetical protein